MSKSTVFPEIAEFLKRGIPEKKKRVFPQTRNTFIIPQILRVCKQNCERFLIFCYVHKKNL